VRGIIIYVEKQQIKTLLFSVFNS